MLDAERTAALDATIQQILRILSPGSFDLLENYREVVLCILALKFLTDIQTGGSLQLDDAAANGVYSPLRHLEVPATVHFPTLLRHSREPGIGNRLNSVIQAFEAANPLRLDGLGSVDFASKRLGEEKERDRVLAQLLEAIGHAPVLDFRQAGDQDFAAAAYACDALLTSMAGTLGKRGIEFYTPPAISQLLAELTEPRSGESIMDPCCGTGGTLIAGNKRARRHGDDAGCELFGQEINGETLALAKLNMLLHNETRINLAWGDVLQDPKFVAPNHRLRSFDVVLSSPPYNLSGWQRATGGSDPLERFWRGMPPPSSANYAFISHMVESMSPTGGRMAVVVPMGALFRGSTEMQIRRKLLEENLFDAVIALPAKLMPSTGIPIAVLVLRRERRDRDVLFIDARSSFEYGKTQNTLGADDLQKILQAYQQRQQETNCSRLVSIEEIAGNEFNLNVSRYLQAEAKEEQIDLETLRGERLQLQRQLGEIEASLTLLKQDISY